MSLLLFISYHMILYIIQYRIIWYNIIYCITMWNNIIRLNNLQNNVILYNIVYSTTVIAEVKEMPRALFSNIPPTSSVNNQIRNTYLSFNDHESTTSNRNFFFKTMPISRVSSSLNDVYCLKCSFLKDQCGCSKDLPSTFSQRVFT